MRAEYEVVCNNGFLQVAKFTAPDLAFTGNIHITPVVRDCAVWPQVSQALW